MPGTMFIQPSTLASLPTSGPAWDALVSKSNTDPGSGNLGALDQLHPLAVFSIALRWAKDGGGLGQAYVINEIKAVMGTESSAGQPLNPYRTLGAYVMAADLVDMPGSTVGANGQTFDAWMQSWPNKVIPGQSNWNTLEKCARTSGNNWGACARTSLMAVLLWLKKRSLQPSGFDRETLLADLVKWHKRFVGDTSVPNTFVPTGSFQSSWATTTYPSQQGVINPDVTGAKAWQNGANAEDASRSSYPTKTGAGQHYQYETLDSLMVMLALLINAGYADAAGWGNNGVRRNYKYMITNGLTSPSSDYHHFFWMQPTAANHLFTGLGMPVPSGYPSDRSQRRMLTTHTDWLASTGSTWLKTAGTPGGGGVPTVTNPTAAYTVTLNGQAATFDASATTLGSAAISTYRWNFGDGFAVTDTDATYTYTYTNTEAQTFLTELAVTAADGGTDIEQKSVTVEGSDGAPVAAFTVTPGSGTTPLTVSYDFAGSFDPDGDALTRRVNWGDGIVEDDVPATGSHTYETPITETTSYTVRATVTAAGVQSSPVVRTVTVRPRLTDTPAGSGAGLFVVIGGQKVPLVPAYDGAWDGVHLVMGDQHIWVDDAGLLRTKPGAPTGPTDGRTFDSPGVQPLAEGESVPSGTPEGTLFVLYRVA